MIRFLSKGDNPISHDFVNPSSHLISAHRRLLMASNIPLSPHMVNHALKQQPCKDSIQLLISHTLQPCDGPLPIWINFISNKPARKNFPNCIRVWTCKIKVVSSLISFSTENTSLCHAPLCHSIPCRQSALDS